MNPFLPHFTPLENMMIDIIEVGNLNVWNSIEEIINPIQRLRVRKLFFEAVKKLKDVS